MGSRIMDNQQIAPVNLRQCPAGMGDVAIYTELGRFMMGPYGCLVTKAIQNVAK